MTLMVFAFCGVLITVLLGFIVYQVCNGIASDFGHLYAIWPIIVAFALGFVSLVSWCFFAQPLFEPVCVNGHRNDMTADYCIVCGVDLAPSCDCGHVWATDQAYCPHCGKERE